MTEDVNAAEGCGNPRRKGDVTIVGGTREVIPVVEVPKNASARPPQPPPNWERSELSSGKILLYTEAFPDALPDEDDDDTEHDADVEEGFAFYVESASLHNCTFTIDFDGTTNYALAGGLSGMSATISVAPYERQPLARLLLVLA